MTTLAYLSGCAVALLIGIGIGCDLMRRAVDTEARRRAATERAYDKLWAKYNAVRRELMRDMNPWYRLESEIASLASLPEERRH